METLILATDDCSAGRLKASKAADRIIAMTQRLVEGPLPTDEEQTAFFGSVQLPRERRHDTQHWLSRVGPGEDRRLGNFRPSLCETCQGFDRIEIWVDPDPNSYLILLQLIEALKSLPGVLDCVSLAFPPRYVGELSGVEFENTRPRWQPLTSERLDLASRAWHAYHSPTPEAWFGLLNENLSGVLGLRSMILRILAELPAATNGLSAGEAQLLALIKLSGANFSTVFGGHAQLRPRPTLGYWEAGQRIVSLSRCNLPIIIGIEEESFSVDLHADEARFAAFGARSWSLSTIGQSIVEGRDDLTKHVSVD